MLVPVLVPVNILLWLFIIWLNELGRITIHYIVYPMQMKSHCSVANPAAKAASRSTKLEARSKYQVAPRWTLDPFARVSCQSEYWHCNSTRRTERSIISMKLS